MSRDKGCTFNNCTFVFTGMDSAAFRAILDQALEIFGEKLMATVEQEIDAFAAETQSQLDRIGAAVDGLTGDVTSLKAEIQALTDQLANVGIPQSAKDALAAIVARATSLADGLAALDAATPNPVPPP